MSDLSTPDFSALSAVLLNCTLKATGQPSNTAALLSRVERIFTVHGISVSTVRPVDLQLAPGVAPDMTDEGADVDEWPQLSRQIMEADILLLATPIWLGEESSICRRVIERLYSESSKQNERGQYAFYGKVGGAVITGNEDGAKHCAMSLLYALQHVGYTIPPQADAAWVGEAGPGPSYADDGSGGPENPFTKRTTAFMSWNLMHLAHLLRSGGGFPLPGNRVTAWENGEHPFQTDPAYS